MTPSKRTLTISRADFSLSLDAQFKKEKPSLRSILPAFQDHLLRVSSAAVFGHFRQQTCVVLRGFSPRLRQQSAAGFGNFHRLEIGSCSPPSEHCVCTALCSSFQTFLRSLFRVEAQLIFEANQHHHSSISGCGESHIVSLLRAIGKEGLLQRNLLPERRRR